MEGDWVVVGLGKLIVALVAEKAAFAVDDFPLFAIDFDGFAFERIEVEKVGVGTLAGDAGVNGVDDWVEIGVFVEFADDGTVLGTGGEVAVFLEGLGEPGAEHGGVEGDGVAGKEGDAGEGLLVWGEEDVGAAGDFEEL